MDCVPTKITLQYDESASPFCFRVFSISHLQSRDRNLGYCEMWSFMTIYWHFTFPQVLKLQLQYVHQWSLLESNEVAQKCTISDINLWVTPDAHSLECNCPPRSTPINDHQRFALLAIWQPLCDWLIGPGVLDCHCQIPVYATGAPTFLTRFTDLSIKTVPLDITLTSNQ